MDFNAYIVSLPVKPSEVKYAILRRLWNEGTGFPRGWVKSSELLSITKQKYFDRRIRELRDQIGCDIEFGMVTGEHSYRLKSPKLEEANPRAYLTDSQKRTLFETHSNKCSICGRQFEIGLRGLQADHKVPLKRRGPNDISNYQPVCVSCNVGKRRACAGCKLDCQTCPWAFPEKIGNKIIVYLSPDLYKSLSDYGEKEKKSMDSCIIDALCEYLKNQKK